MYIRRDTYAGFCIYCGNPGITDEHWLSKWLGGEELIKDGTCGGCQKIINDQIENPLSRGMFWSARKILGLKSHSNSKEPIPLTLITGGVEQDILVPHEDNPGIMFMLALPAPSIYSQDQPKVRTGKMLWDFVYTVIDPQKHEEFKVKYPSDEVTTRSLLMVPFLRLLAKIAHGFAVHCGILFRPLLRDFILEGDRAVGEFYVGGVPGMGPKLEGTSFLNARWVEIKGKAYLEITIQLFAQLEMPVYTVIVGEELREAEGEHVDAARYANDWNIKPELVEVISQQPGYWTYAVYGDDAAYPEAKPIDIPEGFAHLKHG